LSKSTFIFNRVPGACLAAAVVAAFAGACTRPVASPVAADARWAEQRWPGTTVVDLEQGRGVFVSRCSNCHSLPDPTQKSADEWPSAVDEMAARARLSDEDKARVARYLATMSARSPKAGG
jgi:mono/diheme cytochrome c family protein